MKYNELKYLTAHNAHLVPEGGLIGLAFCPACSEGGHGLVDLKYYWE